MTPRRKAKKQDERRRNTILRELLDELVQHVRNVAKNSVSMPQHELEYAQDRLEWLTDEIWQKVMEYPDED
jgi:uncharacterized protein (UPF0305 family)